MPFSVSTREVLRVSTVYFDASCDRCGVTLEPMDLAEEGTLQFENALVLRFSGGYGMFCDPISASDDLDPEFDKLFCHSCGHAICDFLGLDVSLWHSHEQ